MSQLTDDQRTAIRHEAATGASMTEVARRLGLSVGAVTGSMNGGRKPKVDAAVSLPVPPEEQE